MMLYDSAPLRSFGALLLVAATATVAFARAPLVSLQMRANTGSYTTAETASPGVVVSREAFDPADPSHTHVRTFGQGVSLAGLVRSQSLSMVDTFGTANSYTFAESQLTSSFLANDLVISGSGAPGSTVSGKLNLRLSGFFVQSNLHVSGFGEQSIATIQVDLTLRQTGRTDQTGFVTFTRSVNGAQPFDWSGSSAGLFNDYVPNTSNGSFSKRLTTNTFQLTKGLPFEAIITLTNSTRATTYFQGSASALSDLSHTLSWEDTGPVFELDPGLTVNSAQGAIVDNSFLPPVVVPESGTATLLAPLVGILVIGLAARRIRRPKAV